VRRLAALVLQHQDELVEPLADAILAAVLKRLAERPRSARALQAILKNLGAA
jgi:hypothetical protein